MKLRSHLRALALAGLILAGAAALPGRAHAQANARFSGGLNAPVTLTLNAPVTYVITTAATTRLGFILKNTGNLGDGNPVANSTITFTINNGAPVTITGFQSNVTISTTVAPTDLILFPADGSTVAVGDVVRLLTGSLTTGSGVASAVPTATSYQTFIINTSGTRLTAVSPVPEPSAWAALLAGAGLGGAATLRRRRAA